MRWSMKFFIFLFFLSSAVSAQAQLRLYPDWNFSQKPSGPYLTPPPKPHKLTLNDKLFTDQLIDEFRDRYQQMFGPMELSYLSPDLPDLDTIQIKSFELTERETLIKENEELRKFGEYVARKLFEHHVDSILREKPEARSIYNAKERITNANLSVGRQFQMKAKYSIGGNFLEIRAKNPYLETWVTIDFGPGLRFNQQELVISGRRELIDNWIMDLSYRKNEGLFFIGAKKKISEALSLTLRASTYLHTRAEVEKEHENLMLAGFAYRY